MKKAILFIAMLGVASSVACSKRLYFDTIDDIRNLTPAQREAVEHVAEHGIQVGQACPWEPCAVFPRLHLDRMPDLERALRSKDLPWDRPGFEGWSGIYRIPDSVAPEPVAIESESQRGPAIFTF